MAKILAGVKLTEPAFRGIHYMSSYQFLCGKLAQRERLLIFRSKSCLPAEGIPGVVLVSPLQVASWQMPKEQRTASAISDLAARRQEGEQRRSISVKFCCAPLRASGRQPGLGAPLAPML